VDKFVVHDMSMTPTLLPGDRLLAVRRRPDVGQIAVLPHPATAGMLLVKRVVAGPGWEVRLVDTRLELTGPGGAGSVIVVPAENRPRAWSLSDDEVFVLSDASHITRADSRLFGPVPVGSAMSVIARYRPLRRLGRV
jgi:type IV secretory pathway protease TraF